MPNPSTTEKAREDLREGKAPSTAAGEFVKEEIDHVREGKHGARSPQQAIAIGLSEARRAGIPLKPPKKGSAELKKKAERDYEKGQAGTAKKTSPRRSAARKRVMEREPKSTASPRALSKQAKKAAKKRGASSRQAAAKKAVRTKGKAELRSAAKKAARTRARTGGSGKAAGRRASR
ncbi:MAG TPA: DUF6496 domain-containing protein [Acidobacteriaceae bacterium]|jgi:hypothetical protein|nr:DUF6496 domain-containing protein [Acidobacteriaceae bacterium]